MIVSAIAAMTKDRVIGRDGRLPWSLPEDMKFFREKTAGSILIMGRKTFDSLGKPLKGRYHIVITRDAMEKNQSLPADSSLVHFVTSLDEATAWAKKLLSTQENAWPEEVFIIGGSQIYEQSMQIIHRLYLTVIEENISGDAYFPSLPSTRSYQVLSTELPTACGWKCQVQTYEFE